MFDWAKKLVESVRGAHLWDFLRGKHSIRVQAVASLGPAPGPVPPAWTRYHGARPEPRGAPTNTVLALGGSELFAAEDMDVLFEVCDTLGIPVDSLFTVIRHESHGNAAALNPEPAAGLIQITAYAKLAGFETADKVRSIVYQTAREQLRGVVSQYYGRSASVVRGMTPGELLLFNFTPKFVGRAESTVISSKGEPIYDKNYKGFDIDGKGVITVADVYKAAERVTAEAGGKRVGRDGRVFAPAADVPSTNLPVLQAPRAPKSTAAPATQAPPTTKPAIPAAKPAPASTAPRAPAPKPPPEAAQPEPAQDAAVAGPATLVSGPAGNADRPAFTDFGIGSPGGNTGIQGAQGDTFSSSLSASTDDGASGASFTDMASGALSALSTGGAPLSPASDTRGLLLAAARAQLLDPVGWTWVAVGDEDLEVYVPNDAFRATLGDTAHVRIPASYADLRVLCALLGCVPATKDIVDAIYQAATVHPKPVGLVQKEGDDKLMNTVGFVLRYHAQLERQLQDAATAAGLTALPGETLIESAGKWWILDPKLLKSKYGARGAVTYGWFKSSVSDPVQTPQAPHDDGHSDYSQVARLIHRYARRPSTGEQIDLCDYYADKWPELGKFIDVFR
jgi:hypothetical protein